MDEIDIFEKYTIKEISKKSRIGEKDLQNLKDEKFDKFSKTKGLGFIKILEREYGVDLSQKRERLLEYLKENDKLENSELFIAPPKKEKSSKPLAILLLIALIVAIGYFAYSKRENNTNNKDANYTFNPMVNEAKNLSGIDEKNDTTKFLNSSSSSISSSSKNDIIENTADQNSSYEDELNDTKNYTPPAKELDTKTAPPKEESNKTITLTSQTQDINKTKDTDTDLTIYSKNRLWIGVISLKDHKKRSYLKEGNTTIKIKNDTLISTGYGYFTLYYKGIKKVFSTKQRIRLLIKNDTVTKITKEKFLELNRGKNW